MAGHRHTRDRSGGDPADRPSRRHVRQEADDHAHAGGRRRGLGDGRPLHRPPGPRHRPHPAGLRAGPGSRGDRDDARRATSGTRPRGRVRDGRLAGDRLGGRPPLAGVLVNYLDWRGIFWVTAGCGVLLTAAVARIVPETSLRSRARFDCAGALLLAGALTSLLLALSKGAQWGWPATTALVGTGGLLIALWVPLQLRSRSPLVDLRVAARPRVLLVNVSSALVGFALFSNVLVSIQLLQTPRAAGFGFGLGILEAGLWMIPPTLVGVAMAPVAARAITRYGAWTTLLIATVEMAIVFVARVYLSTELWQVLVGAAAVGIGLSLAQAAIPILIMRSVPPSETASANGLSSLLRSIGRPPPVPPWRLSPPRGRCAPSTEFSRLSTRSPRCSGYPEPLHWPRPAWWHWPPRRRIRKRSE
ncbi:MFS transporter, partial [Rhodococcus hoagii]|nr:MFS transporter [Prescottella equi]